MKKPTETIYQAAIARRANGYSLDEIIAYFERNFGVEIPKTTLHRKCKIALSGTEFGTVEQELGTGGTVAGTLENAAIETLPEKTENRNTATVEHSEQVEQRSKQAASTLRMDAVYYAVIVTGCIGFWNVMGWWGVLIAVPYLLISVECLENAKDVRLAEMSGRWQSAVIVMELVASVFNHSLFNAVFWQHIDALPVNIVRQGNLVLIGSEAPWYAAFGASALLFCFAFFAVDTVIQKAKMQGK